MVDTKMLLYMNGSLVLVVIVVFIVAMRKVKLQQSGLDKVVEKKKISNKYIFYTNNIFTRKKFRRVAMRYASMSCYDYDTVKALSVRLFEKSMITSLAMPLAALILLRNVMLAVLVGFVGYIYYELTVDRAIDKVYREITDECAFTIQSIRDEYLITDSIPQAVLNCDKGKYLHDPMNKIYEILTDVNGDELLYQFKRVAPVRILGTLADTLYISNDEGDVREDGKESAFAKQMSAIRDEATSASMRMMETENAFKSLDKLALVGLIGSPVADWFLLTQIPGTALYLKGMYGSIEKAFLIGVTILAYYVISILRRPTVVNQVDRVEFIDNLSRHYKVKKFVANLLPKKHKTKMQWKLRLKSAISSKTMEYIYTAKVVYALIVGLITAASLIGFVWTARSNLYHNYGSLSFIDTTKGMTEKDFQAIKKMDNEYMEFETMPDETYTSDFIRAHIAQKDYEIQNQVQRLQTKYKHYHGMGFKWYYIIIIYLGMVAGWFAPEVSVMMRKALVKFEEVEDVMQLQTVMITISNTRMDTLDALYWLMTESTIHKAPLRYAYLEYPSDPEGALVTLKDSVASSDLKRLIAKLEKTVLDLSMRDAFSDIAVDKANSLVRNDIIQKEQIKSKKEWARLIAGAPISILLMGGFVLPILILGVTQLMTAFSTMG